MPKKHDARVLDALSATIKKRRGGDPEKSYTAKLLSKGTKHIAKKLAEESAEAVIDAVSGNKDGLVRESADVLYHLLVLWADAGIAPPQVWAELARREGISGIAEKRARGAKIKPSRKKA
ncbi:MAG: phosphoribosyl-ATP diphosphatase [Alphaproteobacteria bacterium]|nr:phosphoribosyl-ATP diphosphatase [Alphaproteobacteria bacterium]